MRGYAHLFMFGQNLCAFAQRFYAPDNSFSRICNLSATTLGSSKITSVGLSSSKSRKDFACNSSKGQRPNARRVACAHAQQFFCLLRVFVFGMQRELFPCKFIALSSSNISLAGAKFTLCTSLDASMLSTSITLMFSTSSSKKLILYATPEISQTSTISPLTANRRRLAPSPDVCTRQAQVCRQELAEKSRLLFYANGVFSTSSLLGKSCNKLSAAVTTTSTSPHTISLSAQIRSRIPCAEKPFLAINTSSR